MILNENRIRKARYAFAALFILIYFTVDFRRQNRLYEIEEQQEELFQQAARVDIKQISRVDYLESSLGIASEKSKLHLERNAVGNESYFSLQLLLISVAGISLTLSWLESISTGWGGRNAQTDQSGV